MKYMPSPSHDCGELGNSSVLTAIMLTGAKTVKMYCKNSCDKIQRKFDLWTFLSKLHFTFFNTVIMYSNYSSTHLLNATIVFYIACSDLNPKLYLYFILKNM